MTPDEARKVAAIAMTADGGCSHCFNPLLRQLRDAFPEHDWKALAIEADPFEADCIHLDDEDDD